MIVVSRTLGAVLFAALAAGCAAGPKQGTTLADNQHVGSTHELDPVNVIGGSATHPGDAYDAGLLFERANELGHANQCEQAIPLYEKLVKEFPDASVVPTAYFYRGVCLGYLSRFDEAVQSYRDSVSRTHALTLLRDVWFQIAIVGERTLKPAIILEATNVLVEMEGLTADEKIEALARKAAAHLAINEREEALSAAHRAIDFAPTRQDADKLAQRGFIAEARFIIAEEMRMRAEQIVWVAGAADQREKIRDRMTTVQGAHLLYNESVRMGDAYCAAASGFHIGEMYRGMYNAVVNAPVPPTWDERAIGVYRGATAEKLKPLIEKTIAAWQLTLDMAQRTGLANNDWIRRADEQIGALRELINSNGATTRPAPPSPSTNPNAPPVTTPATVPAPPTAPAMHLITNRCEG